MERPWEDGDGATAVDRERLREEDPASAGRPSREEQERLRREREGGFPATDPNPRTAGAELGGDPMRDADGG